MVDKAPKHKPNKAKLIVTPFVARVEHQTLLLVMFRPGFGPAWGGFGFLKSWAEPKPPLMAWLWPGLAQAAAFGRQHRYVQ